MYVPEQIDWKLRIYLDPGFKQPIHHEKNNLIIIIIIIKLLRWIKLWWTGFLDQSEKEQRRKKHE